MDRANSLAGIRVRFSIIKGTEPDDLTAKF